MSALHGSRSFDSQSPRFRLAHILIAALVTWTTLGIVTTAEAQLYGSLDIYGHTSIAVSGSNGSFRIATLANNGNPATISGTIVVTMWATRRRYRGGTIVGTRVLKCRYNGLQGGYKYTGLSCKGRITTPPRGSYYITLTAAEYDAQTNEFYTEDHVSFSRKLTFR